MDMPQPPIPVPSKKWNEPSDWKDHGPAWRKDLPELCFCDRNNIGEPGVSCGDCPNRDYRQEPA